MHASNAESESPSGSTPESLHHLEAQRRAKRDKARELGFEPYGVRVDGLISCAAAREAYDADADAAYNASAQAAKANPGTTITDTRPRVGVAGRVVLLRDNGKLMWMSLRDASGDMQVAISQKDCKNLGDAGATPDGTDGFGLAKLTDLGDVMVVRGRLMKTKTGEITIWADDVRPGAKSLVTPPEKHAGLSDVEIRYRQRYVDLWANPETMRVFEARSRLVTRMRDFMIREGYVEVETPMLQALAGGAAARPFITKMNALDISLYMRIAPELYLKRLLVGGMPRVFEINRNFRNEGLDKQHNPEFTMLEAYRAFGDVETVMDLTERLIRDAASAIASNSGNMVLPFGELSIDYSKPFRRTAYGELFAKAYGFDMNDVARCRAEFAKRHPNIARENPAGIEKMDHALLVNELFEDKEHGGEAQLDHSVPTFITDYPTAISPLTRPKRAQKPGELALADRADLFIAGMEVAPHYTELNDPDVQEAKFREQLQGLDADKNAEEQTYRTMDHDFLRALKVGMPPAGGMGLGVDRLVMILTNQRTIRDVVLFPLMRPED
jgi:lysyl-tRNA synthetase class 2